jgi:hypothetical protein
MTRLCPHCGRPVPRAGPSGPLLFGILSFAVGSAVFLTGLGVYLSRANRQHASEAETVNDPPAAPPRERERPQRPKPPEIPRLKLAAFLARADAFEGRVVEVEGYATFWGHEPDKGKGYVSFLYLDTEAATAYLVDPEGCKKLAALSNGSDRFRMYVTVRARYGGQRGGVLHHLFEARLVSCY